MITQQTRAIRMLFEHPTSVMPKALLGPERVDIDPDVDLAGPLPLATQQEVMRIIVDWRKGMRDWRLPLEMKLARHFTSWRLRCERGWQEPWGDRFSRLLMFRYDPGEACDEWCRRHADIEPGVAADWYDKERDGSETVWSAA